MVKNKYLILILLVSLSLASCTRKNQDDISKQSTTEVSQSLDKQTVLDEITTSDIIQDEETSSSTENETLFYEAYSVESLEELYNPIKNIMSDEIVDELDNGGGYWMQPTLEECVIYKDMELNPYVNNENYIVEPKVAEFYDETWHIFVQIVYPYITLKGNEEATQKANEEIKKQLLGRFYDMSKDELLNLIYENKESMGEWFVYYGIGYMDENLISFVMPHFQRQVLGVTIDLKTGDRLQLKDMEITDKLLLDALNEMPDDIISDFYMEQSKEQIRKMIEEGYASENYFIKDSRLYLGVCYNRMEFIYWGYDNLLRYNQGEEE